MKNTILIVTCLNIMFFVMHEFDAFHQGEWKMFKFLNKLKESTQYLIFLYIHVPLTFFCFYYLWSTYHFNNQRLWLIINIFSIFHFGLHLFAQKWELNVFNKSNVFNNIHSFIFISGWAITGIINLILMNSYQ